MDRIKTALSLLGFLFLSAGTPVILTGLVLYLTPGLVWLPQRIAGLGILAAFGYFLMNIMLRAGFLFPPLRRGVRLCQRGFDAFAAASWVQRWLIKAVEAHRVYLLLLLLLLPLIAHGPTIYHHTIDFLAKGFADNAFVAVIVSLLVLGLCGLIVLFYGLLLYTMAKEKRWELWAPVEMGFLYIAFMGIVYGVSLGISLFSERPALGSWKWWLHLWMGCEFFSTITRLFVLISIDKFAGVELGPKIQENMRSSQRSIMYGLGLCAVAVGVFLWQHSEGVSHATATALMVALSVDRGCHLLWPARAQGSSLQ